MRIMRCPKTLIGLILLLNPAHVMAQNSSVLANPTRGLPDALPDANMGKQNSQGCYSFLPLGPFNINKDGHVNHTGSTDWNDKQKHLTYKDSGSGITYDIQFYINNIKDQKVSAARVTSSLVTRNGSTQVQTKIYTFLLNDDHTCAIQHIVTSPNDKDHPDFDLQGCKDLMDLLRTNKVVKSCASYWHKENLYVDGRSINLSHWMPYKDKPECKSTSALWDVAYQKAGSSCNYDGVDDLMTYTQDYFAAFPMLKATDVQYNTSNNASKAK